VNVLLVPAHPGFPGQIPQSRKTVVCVCVCNSVLIVCSCMSHNGIAYRQSASSRVSYNRSQTHTCTKVKRAFIAGPYKRISFPLQWLEINQDYMHDMHISGVHCTYTIKYHRNEILVLNFCVIHKVHNAERIATFRICQN